MPGPDVPTATLSKGAIMPMLGLGTWQSRGSDAYDAVRSALDVGYRHFDTATMYRNERQVGRAVRESGVSRDEVFVTTKLQPSDADRADDAIEASLRELELDYVDLWLIHWPPGRGGSPRTWQRLLDARAAGLARDVGVSNYSLAQIDEVVRATGETPVVNQIEWGPALFDAAVLAGHEERGVVLEGYSPFRSTDLRDHVLASVALAHSKTSHQVVLRWHLQHGIVAIPKSINPERIAANFEVFDFELTPEEMSSIDALGA
jgi:diketogulonate reductase-like aldo/keto reductase